MISMPSGLRDVRCQKHLPSGVVFFLTLSFVFTSFREQDEAYINSWDRFVKMVSILRDLVRADCKGTWDMHFQSVQAVLPLFAGCDRINYLSWGSVYLEDMRKLAQDAPSMFENFKAGKFMVKRTEGQFTAVGADMCLEQTINRPQKSAGGIIGSTEEAICSPMRDNSP